VDLSFQVCVFVCLYVRKGGGGGGKKFIQGYHFSGWCVFVVGGGGGGGGGWGGTKINHDDTYSYAIFKCVVYYSQKMKKRI